MLNSAISTEVRIQGDDVLMKLTVWRANVPYRFQRTFSRLAVNYRQSIRTWIVQTSEALDVAALHASSGGKGA